MLLVLPLDLIYLYDDDDDDDDDDDLAVRPASLIVARSGSRTPLGPLTILPLRNQRRLRRREHRRPKITNGDTSVLYTEPIATLT